MAEIRKRPKPGSDALCSVLKLFIVAKSTCVYSEGPEDGVKSALIALHDKFAVALRAQSENLSFTKTETN